MGSEFRKCLFLFFIKRGAMFFTQTSPLGSVTYFGCFLYITTYQQAICANAVIVQVIG